MEELILGIDAKVEELRREVIPARIRAKAGERRLLIVGTGRCGTMYGSQVFNLPHERCFDYHLKFGRELRSEVSCMAVPYLWLLDREDWYIVHLVRHPQRVMASLGWVFFNQDRKFNEFLRFHYGEVGALEYYKRVIDRIDCIGADEVLRVEDLGVSRVNCCPEKLKVWDYKDVAGYCKRFGYEEIG